MRMDFELEQCRELARTYYEASAEYNACAENCGYELLLRAHEQLFDELTGAARNVMLASICHTAYMHGLNETSLQYAFIAACNVRGIDLQFSTFSFQNPGNIVGLSQFDTAYGVVVDIVRALMDAAIEVGPPGGDETVEQFGVQMVVGPSTRQAMADAFEAKLQEHFPGLDLESAAQQFYESIPQPDNPVTLDDLGLSPDGLTDDDQM